MDQREINAKARYTRKRRRGLISNESIHVEYEPQQIIQLPTVIQLEQKVTPQPQPEKKGFWAKLFGW